MVAIRAFTLCLVLSWGLLSDAIVVHEQQAQRCPRMCNCSLYMGFNSANCSDQNLISANIGMPTLVEHIDLSYNDITTVDKECFKDLRHLQVLLLNQNSISAIELDAFSSLTKLTTINLTNNRLESFDNRIFEQNENLTNVDLSGNKFMHLPNMPILRSASLEILALHNSQLTHYLLVNYFGELPNIKFIDLSDHLLIVLNLAAFATNSQLRRTDMQHNRIKCDEQTEMSIIWLNRIHVDIAMDNCPKSRANETTTVKFERILMMPSNVVKSFPNATTPDENDNNTLIDLRKVWKIPVDNDHNIPILNEQCIANETTIDHACQLFEICVSNFTQLIKEVEEKFLLKSGNHVNGGYDPVELRHSWYEFVSVQVAFYGGLMLGTLFGAVLLFTLKFISDCATMSGTDTAQSSRRKRRNRQFVASEMRENSNNTAEVGVNENGSNSRRNRSRELVTMNNRRSGQSTPFFAIFYERPVRHRYYRQISRSTTNLVRRLSQSRLFVNSSRAQRRNRQESTNTMVQNESSPESHSMLSNQNEPETVDVVEVVDVVDDAAYTLRNSSQSLNISSDCSQNVIGNRLSAIRTVASENNLLRNGGVGEERCETPPPPYNIVAINVHH